MTTRREIPIAPLREAFEKSGLTRAEVAARLGWYRSDRNQPDGTRFARAVGLSPVNFGRGYGPRYIQSTSYERATRLAEAIGVDFVEVDL